MTLKKISDDKKNRVPYSIRSTSKTKPVKKVSRDKLDLVKWFMVGTVLLWFSLLILLPLFGIVRETIDSGLKVFIASLTTPAALHAFWLTLLTTIFAVVVNTILGTIVALVFARQNFKGKLFLESIIDLPFAVSPVVAGFMFILLFGPKGWIGSWFESMDIKIIYAVPGMIIATVFVTIPFVCREILPMLREIGTEQDEAASILGADRKQTFFWVTLPSIKWGLVYGVTLTIARSIGEFGAVLVVSGSIINKTQTATLRIHDQFTDFNYTGAFAAALVLAISSFIILLVIQYLYKQKKSAATGNYSLTEELYEAEETVKPIEA